MKKLITIFSFLLLLSLLLIGCESTDQLISPVSDPLQKNLTWSDPITMGDLDNGPIEVELIAGQFYKVGIVTIEKSGGGISVKYIVQEPGGTVSDVHVDLASTLSRWTNQNKTGFHVNNNGNPQFGQFDSKNYGQITYSSNNSVAEVFFSEQNLKDALGVNSLGGDPKFYIAVHGVVCFEEGSASFDICPEFQPDEMIPDFLPSDNTNYTVKAVLTAQGTYYGFCVDNTRWIQDPDPRPVDFICSYDPNFPNCDTFLELPENLDLVNWIINNRQLNWDRRTIQAAIWQLINPSGTATNWYNPNAGGYWQHDVNLRLEIVAAAYANGEGFVPGCAEKVLVIVWGTANNDICDPDKQVVAIEMPAECLTTECETAMGFDAEYDPLDDKWYAVPNNSSLFPGHVWFRYFSFNW